MCLLYAFPLLFLGEHGGAAAQTARVAGWAFAIWGSALYWWAAALYLVQTRQIVATAARHVSAARHDPALARRRPPRDDEA
jgi:cardiolipin synthase